MERKMITSKSRKNKEKLEWIFFDSSGRYPHSLRKTLMEILERLDELEEKVNIM